MMGHKERAFAPLVAVSLVGPKRSPSNAHPAADLSCFSCIAQERVKALGIALLMQHCSKPLGEGEQRQFGKTRMTRKSTLV
ncbi:MAG TPA: hypothetical protein VFV38_26115 [Ktedonobacteraceae bacterium]|nr:hypothetical protein [Ktedonobacteraceae bacterium]